MDRLGKEDWLRAARLALLRQGPDAVRVEPLARDLGVTKGSFYWHFRDRGDLLETLLVEWESETGLLTDALRQANPRGQLPAIMDELARRNVASERGESPSDAAIFAWAGVDPGVAARANKAEAERMALFRKLTKRAGVADLFYYAYHGFLLRRRRVPQAAGDFDNIARLALKVLGGTAATKRRRARAIATSVLVLAAGAAQGCTTLRIIRHRDPHVTSPLSIFHQRVVRKADVPFRFAVAPVQRNDLDTVSVRDVDFRLRPLREYAEGHKLRALVVIRNDTILYERYRLGHTDSTRASSFSVAKSFTSALLGLALQQGAIRSLDDSVTRYIPELAKERNFAGITIRHVLGMQSGFGYSRTNGNWWHDLRSGDAHFYYAHDFHDFIEDQRRVTAPGTEWAYKDSDTNLLAWILVRATGKSLAQQLEEGVWRRIGTERDASWDLDHRDGNENAASGLNATARDFARFGRLYLRNGDWNGMQVVPREWVIASTMLDSSRNEPEVTTWWKMQHTHYWWIPMHNWSADRDFYADGSRGQRIYVNRRLNTIIVQQADASAQDFPFRKIAYYLAGERYVYPRVVANQLYAAIAGGATADSVRSLHRSLVARSMSEPASITYTRASIDALARQLEATGRPEMAEVVRALPR
jgi:CubicO group peptidase (beta-lactamase class C family)